MPWVDIEVSALGYYDDAGDGLVTPHLLGVFEAESEELVTATVTVDSQSALEGSFRYEPIAPVVLKAGRSYVVVGDSTAPFDKAVNDPEGPVWAPELRGVQYRTGHGRFGYPAYVAEGQLWMIANFIFLPVSATTSSP